MNYSRNLRKAAMVKRVILLLIIAALVGLLIGAVLGYTVKTHITAKEQPKVEEQTEEPTQEEPIIYGAYDKRYITEEISLDWAGNLNFKPLNVDMDKDLQEFIYNLADGYNLDFTLVMALIQHESSFQPDIISKSNDYGLMQINKCNHKYITEKLGITDFLNPYKNVRAGTFILRKLFEKYQNTNMVLMAYNMGEKGASRLWKNGIYETNYTESILNIQQKFNKQLEGK